MPKRRVTSTVNHPKGLDTGAFVGVIALPVAALFFLLQANGVVTVGWWISGLIYISPNRCVDLRVLLMGSSNSLVALEEAFRLLGG